MMKIEYTNMEIDFAFYDRVTAILIGENRKIYESNNHQECFCCYCKDLNNKQSWNIKNWDDEEEISGLTYSLFMDEEKKIYGFDVWKDYKHPENQYLVPHFKHNLKECLDIINKLSNERGYILGVYKHDNFHSLIAKIITIE